MAIESKASRNPELEDARRRREAREMQALLSEYGVSESAERIKKGEMIRAVARKPSSSMSFGESMDSSGSTESMGYNYTFYVGNSPVGSAYNDKRPEQLPVVKFARLAGRDILFEEDAEAAARELAAKAAPIRLRVWANVESSNVPRTLFEEEGPADVLFARAAREVPGKAKWGKALYSYSVTPLTFPEDTKQNLSELEGVQFKKIRKYDRRKPGQFEEFLKKLQNPDDLPLLAVVGNRRHLINPCLEKIKQSEAARVLKRHPELFGE